MPHFGNEARPRMAVDIDGRAVRAFMLRATGAKDRVCDYCGSTIPVGERACNGCGAAVTSLPPQIAETPTGHQQWIVPVLLCFFFPPALLIVAPTLFWRWLRKENHNWFLLFGLCLFFPPAAFFVAAAWFWHKREQPRRR
ncbi:MAG: hypothetical protein R3C97_12775 [Geminicoccaceae bacterium]